MLFRSSAACTGSVQCDFRHCVDRDSALCVISDNLPAVSSTKAFCMRFTERSVCSKPILSYRAVARVSIEFAMQIPKIRGHVPRSAAKKPRKDGVRFFILLEGESFCIGTFGRLWNGPRSVPACRRNCSFATASYRTLSSFSCAVQQPQLAESLHQARHKDDAERHRTRLLDE